MMMDFNDDSESHCCHVTHLMGIFRNESELKLIRVVNIANRIKTHNHNFLYATHIGNKIKNELFLRRYLCLWSDIVQIKLY